MPFSTRALQSLAALLLAVGVLVWLVGSELSAQLIPQAPRNLPPRPVIMPLDNGSIQTNLPGNIATLPLFLRNGGHFGFGSGAFGQLQANPPAGGVIIPMSQNLGGAGAGGAGGGGILGGMGGCQGGGAVGAIALLGIGGAQGGQQQAFFPCSLQQGQFMGALTQRVIQDGFIVQYGVAATPQVLGGIVTTAVQMGSGFGGLKGNLFNAQQNQQNVNMNGNGGAAGIGGVGGGKIGLIGLSGAYGCY
jgi:hypothetical protein